MTLTVAGEQEAQSGVMAGSLSIDPEEILREEEILMAVAVEVGGSKTEGRCPLSLGGHGSDFEAVASIEEDCGGVPPGFDPAGALGMCPQQAVQTSPAVGLVGLGCFGHKRQRLAKGAQFSPGHFTAVLRIPGVDQGREGARYKFGVGDAQCVPGGIDATLAKIPAPVSHGEIESAVVVEVGRREAGPAALVIEPISRLAFGGHQSGTPRAQRRTVGPEESQGTKFGCQDELWPAVAGQVGAEKSHGEAGVGECQPWAVLPVPGPEKTGVCRLGPTSRHRPPGHGKVQFAISIPVGQSHAAGSLG